MITDFAFIREFSVNVHAVCTNANNNIKTDV